MSKEICLDDVLEFIKKYGYKYNFDIQKELNKIRKFTNEDIEAEIEENYDLYKRMSNSSCLIKLESVLNNVLGRNRIVYSHSNSIYVFEDNSNIPTIVVDIISNDNQEYMFERFNNYLKQGVKEYWIISTQCQMFQVHTYDIINKSYVSFLQEPYKELRSRLFPDLVINMEDIFEKIK
ncbi:TPA: hypothetical protein ACF2DR_001749 [Clostridium perfringens]